MLPTYPVPYTLVDMKEPLFLTNATRYALFANSGYRNLVRLFPHKSSVYASPKLDTGSAQPIRTSPSSSIAASPLTWPFA